MRRVRAQGISGRCAIFEPRTCHFQDSMNAPPTPYQVLPHGPGLHILCDTGVFCAGWLECSVQLHPHLSCLSPSGTAPATFGVEIMAQACGMLLLHETSEQPAVQRIGMVGAVRDYVYDTTPFKVGDALRVRVRLEARQDTVLMCDAELYCGRSVQACQSARITLV
jgi:predicted hotdog family 3-hydroxylacyl-ACP dehydratase